MNEEKTSTPKKKERKSHCQALPVDATIQQRNEAHLIKMSAKKIVRQRMYDQMSGPAFIRANIGVDHPDYGMSPAEHMAEKAKRDQGA